MQTGSGRSSTAATRFLEERMNRKGITASFALGGITGSIADLHKKGLIKAVVDVQSFDMRRRGIPADLDAHTSRSRPTNMPIPPRKRLTSIA